MIVLPLCCSVIAEWAGFIGERGIRSNLNSADECNRGISVLRSCSEASTKYLFAIIYNDVVGYNP